MKNKLSEIDLLRLEKKQLMEECYQFEKQLSSKWYFTQNNFGQLLSNTFFSSVKSGFSDMLSPLLGRSKPQNPSSRVGNLMITAAPAIWGFIQPILIRLALKKAKSIFFKKKKKN